MDDFDGKYIAIRQALEFHKLNHNNPFYNDAAKQEEKTMMNSIVRRFGEYFIQEDKHCEQAETWMYGTGIIDQKGFEHVLPIGAGKAELSETGRLYEFLKSKITVDEFLFSPVCRVHKDLDVLIKGRHVYLNEDPTHFFKRYISVGYSTPMKTWRGDPVDMETWDFNDHISQVIKPHPIWGAIWKRFAI
jgi:hypothetical protein